MRGKKGIPHTDPDDPPRPIFGLPRIASTRADYEAELQRLPAASRAGSQLGHSRVQPAIASQRPTSERHCGVRSSAGGTGQPRQLAEEAAGQQRGQGRRQMSEKGRRERARAPDQTEPAVSGQSGHS